MKFGKVRVRLAVGARYSIRCASMALGAMVALRAAPAVAQAQERSLKDIDCGPSLRQLEKFALEGGTFGPPPGTTTAEWNACVAPFNDPSVSTRMSVRPHAMATRTERAGEFPLDSLEQYLVYVPQQCVGTPRCPLVVFLNWGGASARSVIQWQRPVADKYGLIILAPNAFSWTGVNELSSRTNVEAAVKQVLQTFAIDPDKIALIGHCASGPTSLIWGGDNLDVFSRVVPLSAGAPATAGVDPPNKTAEFFLEAGYLESAGHVEAARELRRAGHRVKLVLGLRDHAPQAEGFDFLGRWLQESWAKPDPTARTAPTVLPDPLPLLTTAMVTQMTAFWTRFQQEPESIRTTARQAQLREVLMPVADEQASTVMVDMPALAAKYPSVAAALKAAGLTAQQHEAYRAAMISAQVRNDLVNWQARWRPNRVVFGPIDPTSVLAKNVAFFEAHPDEFNALQATGIWRTP